MKRDITQHLVKAEEVLQLASEMSRAYYKQPLIIAYSGGKDSDVLLRVAMECLHKEDFEVINSHTSVDAPETVYHIRDIFKELTEKGIKATVYIPRDKEGKQQTMWKLIVEKQMPPTRFRRYCCSVLKEASTPHRITATGVRADESNRRKGRDSFTSYGGGTRDKRQFSLEHAREVFHDALNVSEEYNEPVDTPSPFDCTMIANMKAKGDTVTMPLYEWSEYDIWNYIQTREIKVNPLYEKGYKRVGCVGCPLGSRRSMLREFADYPIYKENYIRAFDRMLKRRRENGKDDITGKEEWHKWETGQDVFNWWIREGDKTVYGQISINDYMKGEN